MQYTDIKNRVYFLTKTNSTSFPIADLTDMANRAVEHIVGNIMKWDSRWQFDDTNQTNLPIATTALVANQQNYSIATSHLSIDRVEVKDQSGNWKLLNPIDKSEISVAMTEYKETAGTPEDYDKLGNSVFLYPKPSYSQDASLKLYFTRPPIAFITSDTTASPGFNPLFHDLVPLWVSYDYCVANGLNSADRYLLEIQRKEKDMQEFYGTRSRDDRKGFTVLKENNK